MNGRFITLEGGEGAGKTTQARMLADTLCARGLPVLRTREPGGSPGAELLRGILLGGGVNWSRLAETLLHFAARADHVQQVIRPALDAGIWVVCDRFYDSTMAYQGYGQGADRDAIARLIALVGLRPDLTLVLDVDQTTAVARLRQRGQAADRYEQLDGAFHARVNHAFRAIAAAEPDRCVLLPAGGTAEAIHATVMEAVRLRVGSSDEGDPAVVDDAATGLPG